MANFKGNNEIIVQPNDVGVSYSFQFDVCTSVTANDGYLPYGTSIDSVIVTAKTEEGIDATSALIVSSSELANVVTVALQYPTSLGEGRYKLTFVLTLSDATILEADFSRVEAKDE